MEFKGNEIVMDKNLSELDKKVLDFLEVIDSNYVIVSGYIAILLGRSRGSEDIDIIVDLDRESFEDLWERLQEQDYWCINAERGEAWENLKKGISVRFAEEESVIPNFELFIPRDEYDNLALENRVKLSLEPGEIYISPLELQICYKLKLGSEKDFEDALHIYTVAKESLKTAKLDDYACSLEVEDELGELESEA